MANLPVNKDNVADKDCQYVYIEDGRNKVNDIFELLLILMTLGSEANIKATYIMGEAA